MRFTRCLTSLIAIASLTLNGSLLAAPIQSVADDWKSAAVDVRLSGPDQPTLVWGASEWTLSVTNRGSTPLPFSDLVLTPNGYAGVRVTFEIAREGKPVTEMRSNGFNLENSHAGANPRAIESGGIRDMPVVLHGDLDIDLKARERDEPVYKRFVPAFDMPGKYSVTALLRWGKYDSRSKPVSLEVMEPPAASGAALIGLQALAKRGTFVDVQGLFYNNPWSDLELVAAFVEKEAGTFYGEQQRLALAGALLRIMRSEELANSSKPLPMGVTATLQRVDCLLTQAAPMNLGLERTLGNLRDEVARRKELPAKR